ncbi:hypothetical protein EXIGLDRAFT_90289 [Exidia glandulosa HHB12029]|uniref:Uncharacterized protein n=1 Tax=Exidia glandulosa HHB12029 TaxID=1314781 RepID=A0A165HBY0_EXIGL|nr:hypothetical protein EXIGLDRAFT_90289 [Exidia glandulosa HHB12029]
MTSRPALSSRRRPSSAIFLGNPPPDLPSPPSPASNSSGEDLPSSSKRGAHLPSPPHTNSTGSKSSTGSGSVRVTTANLMDSAQRRRSFASDGDGDEDDEQNERDEDDTARLSDDRRKQTDGNQRSVQRVKSLTERNRQVLDKIASISSGTRLAAPSPSTRNQHSPAATPFPSATVSNRVSFTRSRHEVDFSGSETEREGRSLRDDASDMRQYSTGSSDDRSSTPPASSSRRSGEYSSSSSSARRSGEFESSSSSRGGGYTRQRLVSAPSPANSPKRPTLRSMNTAATYNFPASPHSKRHSIAEQFVDEEEEMGITLNRVGGKKRSPLPREFTSNARRSLDGRNAGYPPETPSRPRSPEAYVGRGSPSPTGSPATFGTMERSPRVQKPGRAATLRENGAQYSSSPLSPHRDRRIARWSLSSDLSSSRLTEESDMTTSSKSSRHRAQFSDGATVGASRNLVQQGLRSAGLERDPDDVFGGRDSRGGRTSTTRSIQAVLSRPSTSMAHLGDDEPRTKSRTSASPAPPRAGSGFQSPGATLRSSQAPPSEHAKLMMDALGMFESQLARFTSAMPVSAGGTTPTNAGASPQVAELLRNTATLVQSAQTLNSLLRAGTARALEAQIDAEVGEGPQEIDAGEVWRRVGGEYRECMRASDDVVRGLTGVLLGVGRVVRETSGHARTGSDDGSAGMTGRRTAEGIRPSSSMSMVRGRDREDDTRDMRERERERDERVERRRTAEFVASTATQKEQRAATVTGTRSASRLERRRGGSQEEVEASPTPVASTSSRSGDFHSSAHARTLPPISIPPPTPTLPSETLLRRKSSVSGNKPRTPAANRLSVVSGGSAATIRASPASAIVTPTTVTSPADERSARRALASASFFSTSGRSRGASITLSGLQERDAARKRTLSSTDRDPDATRAAAATLAASSSRRDRGPAPPVPQTPAPTRPRTERRRTVTEMFS